MEEKLTKITAELESVEATLARFLETTVPTIESQLKSVHTQIADLQKPNLGTHNWASVKAKIHLITTNVPHKKDSRIYQVAKCVDSVVGLKEALLSKHSAVKCIWAFLFILGIACTVFFTYKTADEYLDEPTATKVKLNVSTRNEIPTITLCPSTWVDTEKALALGISEDALKYSLGYTDNWPEMHFDNITNVQNDFFNFYKSKKFSSLLDYYKAIVIDLSTVNTTAAYNRISTGVKLGDKHAYLIGKIFISHQICYAYAFTPTDRSLYSTTTATIKFYDKTKGVVNILPGLWLNIVTDVNFLCRQIPAIFLPPSTNNKILIGVRRFTTLNKKDTPCKERGDVDESYSITSCTADCQNRKYKEMIGCQLFKYAFVSKVGSPDEYCNLLQRTKIDNWDFSEFRATDQHMDMTTACLDQCAPKCEKIIYQWSLQYQQIVPSENEQKNSTNKLTSVIFSIDHMATFDGETVTMTEVNTYSFTELVNNVGGTLGLFVGATLLTFAQVVLFCVEHYCVNKRKNNAVERISLRQGTF